MTMTNSIGKSTQQTVITESDICEFKLLLREEEHADATIEKYLTTLERLKVYLQGNPITKTALLNFRDQLKEDHAAQTVNGAISAINKYLDLNHLADLKLKLLKIQRSVFCPKEKELTQKEYERLIATAKQLGKERLALIIETIGGTGIRVGEVKYITVEAAKLGKAEITMKGKIRTIVLTKPLCKKLLKYSRKNEVTAGPVFQTRNGTPISRKQIWEEMKSICEEARVEASKVFPHNLRHLFARCYYKITHNIVELADVLGHSSIETTRIYLKTSMEEHTKTLVRLGLVL